MHIPELLTHINVLLCPTHDLKPDKVNRIWLRFSNFHRLRRIQARSAQHPVTILICDYQKERTTGFWGFIYP